MQNIYVFINFGVECDQNLRFTLLRQDNESQQTKNNYQTDQKSLTSIPPKSMKYLFVYWLFVASSHLYDN